MSIKRFSASGRLSSNYNFSSWAGKRSGNVVGFSSWAGRLQINARNIAIIPKKSLNWTTNFMKYFDSFHPSIRKPKKD